MKAKYQVEDKQFELDQDKLFKKLKYKPHLRQKAIHNSNARFRTLACGRRWGKTTLAAKEIMKAAMIPNQYLWLVAPTYDLAEKCFRQVYRHFVFDLSHWVASKSEYRMKIKLVNGTVIEGKSADRPESLLGEGLNGMVVDEAARLKKEIWTEYLRPTLADKRGWALFISTSRGMNWFHEMYVKGQDSLNRNYASWNLPTSSNPYISKSEIEEAKASLPERAFEQEWLGKFLEDVGGVFRKVRSCIEKDLLREPEGGANYVMGVDLAKHQDFTVIVVFDARTNNLVYFDRFKDLDWGIQKKKITEVAARYNDARVMIDSAGPGDPIFDDLKKEIKSIIGFNKWSSEKEDLVQDLALAIESKKIHYPEISEMINELQIYAYEKSEKSDRIRYGAPSGYHDDIVMALCLAYRGLKRRIDWSAAAG